MTRKFLSPAITEKLLLAVTILLILLSSAYLISKSLAVNFEQYQKYRDAIVELQALDSRFNQEILKSRYKLFANYDPLVSSLEEQKKIATKLQNISNLGISESQPTIEPILGEIRTLLETRESLSEKFKSRNALLKNSLRYLPLLTNQLEAKFATQEEAKILSSEQIFNLKSTLNSLIRNLLLYNIALDEELTSKITATIQQLDQLDLQYELTEEQFPTALVKSHANIILDTKPQVEQLTAQVLQPLEQYTRSLETTIDRHYKQTVQKVDLYRILTGVWFIMLLIFVNYFLLQRLRYRNPDLSKYKKQIAKLTNLLTEISQKKLAIPETANLSTNNYGSNHNLPVVISSASDNSLAQIADPATNSKSELLDLAERRDELGQLARRVQNIILEQAASEQRTVAQQSFASLTARLILITSNRRKMISPQTVEQLKNIFNQALEELDCQLIAVQGSLEQITLLFSYPLQIQLIELVAHLRAVSSSYLKQNLGDIIGNLDDEESIWSNSYSLESCELPNNLEPMTND